MTWFIVLCLVLCFTTVIVCASISSSAAGEWTDGKGSFVSLVLLQNSEAELLCPTNISKPNITFLKDGELFTSRPVGKITRVKNGIKLPNVLADYDKGNYTCIVQRRNANMSRTFMLDVLIQYRGPPQFLAAIGNKTVKAGEDVELVCHFLSSEATHVSWIKHYMVNGSYANDENELHFITLQSGNSDMKRLRLRNVTSSDAGWYSCIVSSRYGKIQQSAWVEVLSDISLSGHTNDSHMLYAVIAVVVLLMFAAGILIPCCWIRCRPPKNRPLILHDNSLYPFNFPPVLPVDPDWEIDRFRILVGELLGEGAFGKVYKGYMQGTEGSVDPPVVVAVKMLKDGASATELADLLSEMEIMKLIGREHKNIISLIGCCTQSDGPLVVVVEYAPYGNLRDYLRQHMPSNLISPSLHDNVLYGQQRAPLTLKSLISFAYQVARGMEYLASKKIVHRDLAARNILVGSESVMKIADFGLTRNTYQKDYYRRTTDGRLPVKWMAPESLGSNRYTTKSDVWSYGILLWEIFTYGSNPYPSIHVEDLFHHLKAGFRMEKPLHASDRIYEIMLHCWRYCPHERPEFVAIGQSLDALVSESAGTHYLNLECSPDDNDDDDDTENEVFTGTETDVRLLAGAVTPHGSDSQYASLTTSEAPSSPERSVKSFEQDVVV